MQKRPRFPDFIVGGAPKSGTSSLYFWLASHPSICGSKIKEPYYFGDKISRFNKGANYIEHGLEKYSDLFAHCPDDKLAFEATAGYLYSKNAVKGLQELPRVPKMIFVLRNPKNQMYSHYRMQKYRTQTMNDDLAEYIKRENINRFWRYSNSIPMWLNEYPNSHLKFILFEELVQNKVRVMQEICDFLNVAPGFYQDFDFEHRNESVATKSSKLHKFGLKVQPYVPHSLQKILLPFYLKVNSKNVPQSSEEEQKVLMQMEPEFNAEMDRIQNLLPNLAIQEYWRTS